MNDLDKARATYNSMYERWGKTSAHTQKAWNALRFKEIAVELAHVEALVEDKERSQTWQHDGFTFHLTES